MDKKGNPKGIGLSIWRFYLGAGTTEQGDSSGIKNEWRRGECFQNPDGSYDWSKHEGQRWFLQAARDRGVDKFLAFTIAAPVHMAKNKKGFATKGDISFNIAPGKMDDYANYLVEVMAHFEKQGFPFTYLSPFNEPQWDWEKGSQEGTPALNEESYAFIKYLSHGLDQRKLSTRIVAGEAGTIGHLTKTVKGDSRDDQVNFFFSPSSPFYIGNLPNVSPVISGHSYFTAWPLKNQVQTRQELASRIAAVNPDLGYWQSEYCILQKNDEIGQGGKRDLGMPTALYIARIIHHDLTLANARSWQWWTALTQFDFKDGLIYLNSESGQMGADVPSLKSDGVYHDSKLLWAFGNYSRFIRPGMVRIDVQNTTYPGAVAAAENVMVSAFKDPADGKMVLVVLNETKEQKKIVVGNPQSLKGMQVAGFLTSADANLEKIKVNIKNIRVPARSVLTLVASPKK